MNTGLMNIGPTQGARVSKGEDKANNKLEFPIQRFTPTELQKRRQQGLCFHFHEWYSFNHVCKLLFWIEIKDEGDQEAKGEEVEEEPIRDITTIFLNAMMGVSTPQTLWVIAKIGK